MLAKSRTTANLRERTGLLEAAKERLRQRTEEMRPDGGRPLEVEAYIDAASMPGSDALGADADGVAPGADGLMAGYEAPAAPEGAPAAPERPLTREEIVGKLWEVARVPRHALENVKDKDLPAVYQQVMAAAQTPGKHEIKVGKHNLKLQIGPAGEMLKSETKKKSIWGKIGSIALTAAAIIPSPITPFAQAALAIKGAVQGIKNKNFFQAAAGIAGAFSAGATAFVGGAAASFANAAGNAQRLLQGANAAVTAAKAKNLGGVLGGLATAGSAVTGFAADQAGKFATTMGKVAERLGQGAALANTVDGVRRGDLAGALSGGLDFASTVVGDRRTAQRLGTASVAVQRAAAGDVVGALTDGLSALDAGDKGPPRDGAAPTGPSKAQMAGSALSVASGAAGLVSAWKNDGDLEEATRRLVGAGMDGKQLLDERKAANAARAVAAAEPARPAAGQPVLEDPPQIDVLPVGPDLSALATAVPGLDTALPGLPTAAPGLDTALPGLPTAAPALETPLSAAEAPPEKPKPEFASPETVKLWQRQLNAHGANLEEDGVAGPATYRAIQDFQRKQGLKPDGMIGPKTQSALGQAPVVPTAAAAPTSPPQGAPAAAAPGGNSTSAPAPTEVKRTGGNAVQGFFDRMFKGIEDGIDAGVDWANDKTAEAAGWAAGQFKGTALEGFAAQEAWKVTQGVQGVGGAAKGAGRLVTGVGTVVNHPVETAKGLYTLAEHMPGSVPWVIRQTDRGIDAYTAGGGPKEIAAAMDPRKMLEEDYEFGKEVLKGVIEPYKKSVDEGKPAEAIGGVLFDLGTIVLSGGAGGAVKGAAQGGVTAATVASRVARTAEVAGTAARAAETAGTAARVAQTAGTAARSAEVAGTTARAAQTAGAGARAAEAAGAGARAGQAAGTGARAAETAATGARAAETAATGARTAETVATGARAAETAGTGARAAETAGTGARAAETAGTGARAAETAGTGARTAGRAPASVDDVAERAARQLDPAKTESSLARDVYKRVYNPTDDGFKPAFTKDEYKAALKQNGIEPGAAPGGKLVMDDGYWLRVYGKPGQPMGDKVARVYVNTGDRSAPQVSRLLLEEMDKAGVPYQFKMPNNPANFGRRDAGVLYVPEAEYKRVADIARRLGRENPSLFRDGGPAFTKPVERGFSAAAEPVGAGGKSFGETRSAIVARGMKRAAGDGVTDPSKVSQYVRDEFRRAGLDPDKPWLNPGQADIF